MAVTVVENQCSVMPLLDAELSAPIADEMTSRGVKIVLQDKVVGFANDNARGMVEVQVRLQV